MNSEQVTINCDFSFYVQTWPNETNQSNDRESVWLIADEDNLKMIAYINIVELQNDWIWTVLNCI